MAKEKFKCIRCWTSDNTKLEPAIFVMKGASLCIKCAKHMGEVMDKMSDEPPSPIVKPS